MSSLVIDRESNGLGIYSYTFSIDIDTIGIDINSEGS
jgi:hypothetical protein